MQQERHKTKEDTWKSEELKKHLKAMQSESSNEKRHKERRHHREEDRDEHVERRHKSDRKEKRDRRDESDRHAERRERHGYLEKEKEEKHGSRDKERGEIRGSRDKERADRHGSRDKERGERHISRENERGERHGYTDKEKVERDKYTESDKERDRVREHRREKEKKDPERHRTGERETTKEKTYRGENSPKEHGTSAINREERIVRDSLEKSKHRSDDRERRHQEKQEKEKRKQENEDRDIRRQKHREELNSENPEKERRKGDRKHSGQPDGDKRHHSRREKETRGGTEVRSAEDSVENVDRRKEKQSKERHLQREDRERRHREKREQKVHEKKNADNEENTMHQKSSRESTSKQGSGNEKDIEETMQNTDTAYDDSTNYEEDFEDYDDDFEEASEEERTSVESREDRLPVQRNREVEEIQKAMLLENENITAAPAVNRQKVHDHNDQDSETKEVNSSRKAHRGAFIDFGSAKQRHVSSQNASKQKKRSLEILRLIDLDFSSTFSLLDLAPVKEYEMYIRNFGKSNTKQAYVQCNDDAVDREIQTEEIDIEEKWTQHPAEGTFVCGGHKNNSDGNMGLKSKVDSQRLTSFLHSAAQVMAVLLEENRSESQSQSKVHTKEPCMSISEGCFHLNTSLSFLQERKVYHLQFSEAQRHLILTVHSPTNQSDSAILSNKCLICVWNIWQPSAPQKILMCESEVKCCCFSPGKASLVFAGTLDGSVLVWDLREDFSMHQTLTIEDANWTFRSVTFSTDGVFTSVNHTHPVKSIEPVPSAEAKDHGISSLSSPEEDVSGLSFQLASLDENGHLIFWVVVELRKVDLAGSQSDLGLIPGGKVKLIHSSSIDLIDKFFRKDVLTLGIPETMNIKFLPQDSNHFVIGTDIGIVTHGTRYGLIDPPLQYSSLHNRLRPSKITAIDFSPFAIPAFLAGCTDGCIRLHTMSAEHPVMQWNDSTCGQAIVAIQWSLTRPTLFFVLDAASTIHIWDLLQNDIQPVAKESITSDQVLSMSVFGEPERNNNLMGLALAKTSGTVEIQYIKKKLAKPQPKELEKLQLILQEIL